MNKIADAKRSRLNLGRKLERRGDASEHYRGKNQNELLSSQRMLLLNKELESISDSSILCLVLSLALCCDMVDGSGRSFGCRDQWGGRGQTRRAEPTNGMGVGSEH
ncbi:hypothetical protein TNCV_1455411 [Trichonephila clavipes]|nr:hypothetical protein TNCV_1455411 [Trichonephila clavipes]